jgi:1,4-dihydroxy-2-naphthoyl-CoA hydrolase
MAPARPVLLLGQRLVLAGPGPSGRGPAWPSTASGSCRRCAGGATYRPGVSTQAPAWLPTDISSALDEKLGIEITDWNPARVVARMPVEGNTQPYGLLHGGATCSLVEAVGSYAAALGAGPGAQVVGIELNASYHLPATSGHVTAVCTPLGSDLPLAAFAIEVHDDRGQLTASARLTCMVRPARGA